MAGLLKIVVVDDAQPQLDAVNQILQDHGFQVSGFTRADEALEHIRINPPDLVLTDFRLAGVNGIDLIKCVKTFNQDIECILMTGHDSVNTVTDAMRLGVRDYLLKPFRGTELLRVVERAIQARSLEKQSHLSASHLQSVALLGVEPLGEVNELIAQYVHKLNNAMLPFVLELSDHLHNMDRYSKLDQLKLKAFDEETQIQLAAIRKIRALIEKKSEGEFD